MIEILELAGLLCLPAFMLLDLVHRARRYRAPRRWRIQALAYTVFVFFFTMQVGTWWGEQLSGASLLPGHMLGTAVGGLVGILVYELGHYAYHRLAHRSNLLWRAAHQMHHAPESLDAFGANYVHPLDAVIWTSLPILVFFPLLGLTPGAAAIGVAFITFAAVFQHANISTPRWIGYLIQRPESHAIHHRRGRHRSNYADLPLWDMVFGTFENPARADHEVGFYDGASKRVGAVLLGQDVSRPAEDVRVPASNALA